MMSRVINALWATFIVVGISYNLSVLQTASAETLIEQKIQRLLEEVQARPDNAVLRNNLAVAHIERALALHNQGATEPAIKALKEAISQFEMAVEIAPSDAFISANFAQATLNLAALYQLKDQFKGAERYYAKSIELFEKAGKADRAVKARISLARLYYAMDDLDRARDEYLNLISSKKSAMDPTTLSEVCVDLAGVYIASGDMINAKAVLIDSISVAGGNVRSHVMLGQVHYWLGEKEKGLSELQKAEQRATLPSQLNMIGESYRGLGLCDHAMRLFNKALKSASGKDRAHAHVGLGHCTEGRDQIRHFEEAVAAFRDLATDPDLLCVRGKLSFSKYQETKSLKDLREAIQWHQKAVEYQPKASSHHNDLALAYKSLYKEECEEGFLESAMEEYKSARGLHRGPLDPILLANLARGYLDYAVAKESGCRDVREGTYHYTLRRIAEERSTSKEVSRYIEEAISYYERVIVLSPESKEAYEELRSIYHALKREKAVERLETRAFKFGIDLTPIK
jgi:tetratricopeptide (TPR) repeat protein